MSKNSLHYERFVLLQETKEHSALFNRRKLFWFIIALTIVGIVLSVPTITVDREIGGRHIDKVGGPDIDLRPLGIPFEKEVKIHLGLDLSGGTQLTLEADMNAIPEQERVEALDGVVEVLERRIDTFGVSEPRIQKSVNTATGTYRVIAELPGVQDIEEAKKLIGTTAKLEFKEVEYPTPETNAEGTPVAYPSPVYKDTDITGADLKAARFALNNDQTSMLSSPYVVQMEFNSEGAKKFGELTGRLAINKEPLAIFLDGELITDPPPVVQSKITDSGVITMSDEQRAKQLAIQLKAGALPAPVTIVDERHISATLGQDALYKSFIAGIIGIIMVVLFMLFYYRWSGFVAVLALGVYVVFTISLFKLIPITLTLAGIAGFILSVAVAVDANVLIFERMKEELHSGKATKIAVNLGFNRAWTSIRDSNAATLITCFILYWFGSGVIKGFAVALALGVLVSLFTAITVTREFLHIFLESRFMKNKKLL